MNDRRTPFDMFDEMERMFDQMRRGMWSGLDRGSDSDREYGFDTNVTVERADDGYVVLADLPGFEREEIDLRFDDGVLSLRARHDVEDEASGLSRSRRVSESVRIHGDVLVDEIEATYRNGVLEIHLPTEGEMEDDSHRIDID